VYVALDGVVPYAKIKQQRFRRFKSASLSDSWDTNAITPGTAFMKTMGETLCETGSKHGWQISTTDEPGEGEHKVLQWLRTRTIPEGPIVVYGLDGDLILLSLLAGDHLGKNYSIFLLREAMAFGKLVRLDQSKEVDLCFFQINSLKESLQRDIVWSKQQLYDYIFGMSFCGNDFLPTGLSLRIRDDGHSILLACLHSLWKSNKHLVRFDDTGIARPNKEGLQAFTKWIQGQEERLILATIKRKLNGRLGENEIDNLPLIEQAEKPLIKETENGIQLQNEWFQVYNKLALGDSTLQHRKKCVQDYWRGWCWILDYYQGLNVDLEWVYSSCCPPTWKDLFDLFSISEDNWIVRPNLKPKEQLTLVLPLTSWNLLLKTEYRNIPLILPQYWPSHFSLETFSKRFGWECEPDIPMLTPERLRFELARMNISK
jgi:5'-3' exonuclease